MAANAVFNLPPSTNGASNQFQGTRQLQPSGSKRGTLQGGAVNKHGDGEGGSLIRRGKERHRTQAGKGERTLAQNIDPSRCAVSSHKNNNDINL